jgi:ribosome-associated heat shock protein Hsp15
MTEAPLAMRLDKWLWAARFFKTRQLAIEAINGGKVHLNDQRTKPGKEVRPGVRLSIHKGSLAWDVEVLALAAQRRPAAEAALLYQEDEASQARRAAFLAQRRLLDQAPVTGPRPTKRDGRLLRRFTAGEDS